jgi:hypothetical protein
LDFEIIEISWPTEFCSKPVFPAFVSSENSEKNRSLENHKKYFFFALLEWLWVLQEWTMQFDLRGMMDGVFLGFCFFY